MIYGERTRLRAIEREDIAAFLRWFNDPEVREGLLMFAPMGRAEEERWFESRLDRADDYLFAVEALVDEWAAPVDERGTWVHIGNIGLHRIDWKNRNAIFGIALGEKAYWNRGFGTDATRTMLRFGFGELNLHRIELEVFTFNQRAIRAYEKAGFQLEGTRRQCLYQNGAYHDAHIMAVLHEDFLPGTV